MEIPPFASNGLLPVRDEYVDDDALGWECDRAQIRQRLVDAFPHSKTRPQLMVELDRLIMFAVDRLGCLLALISGAFVTAIDNPLSLHIAVIVPSGSFSDLSEEDLWLVDRTFNGGDIDISGSRVTTELIRLFPEGHVQEEEGLSGRRVALAMAQAPLPDGEEGGYLQVFECPDGGDDHAIFDLLAAGTGTP